MNSLLFDQSPLVVSPSLALAIGLNEAIILQQLHYWVNKNTNIHDGKSWVYNTIRQWQEQFPFWSEKTIRRVLEKLIADGIVITGNYNAKAFDRTIWYAIDYDALNAIAQKGKCIRTKCPNESGQVDQMQVDKVTNTIPETTTETTTETTKEKYNKKKFTKPTIEEISFYCSDRNNGIDPQAFFDFYESKGWKVGNTPMRCWQACVRTWERRNNANSKDKSVLDPLLQARQNRLRRQNDNL